MSSTPSNSQASQNFASVETANGGNSPEPTSNFTHDDQQPHHHHLSTSNNSIGGSDYNSNSGGVRLLERLPGHNHYLNPMTTEFIYTARQSDKSRRKRPAGRQSTHTSGQRSVSRNSAIQSRARGASSTFLGVQDPPLGQEKCTETSYVEWAKNQPEYDPDKHRYSENIEPLSAPFRISESRSSDPLSSSSVPRHPKDDTAHPSKRLRQTGEDARSDVWGRESRQ